MVDLLPVILGVLFLLAIVQVVSLVWLARLISSFERPKPEKESLDLLHKAIKKSGAILGQAELEGVKIVADSKYASTEISSVYHDQLRQVTTEMKKELDSFLVNLSKDSGNIVDDALMAFTKRLEEKLTVTEDQMLKLVYDETQKAKADIATYKKTAMEKVQADLGEIVASVAKTVVGKSLSVTDQEDLIIEAFEQAKKEKFVN